MESASIAEVERAISGALTPAFVLAGVAGLLNVLMLGAMGALAASLLCVLAAATPARADLPRP